MHTRIMLPISVALFLFLGLCAALTGWAESAADYTPSTTLRQSSGQGSGHRLATADGLTLTLSADGQVTGLQIDGNELVTTPAPALLLRDLSDAGHVTQPNLLANPGFEEGLANWTQLTNSGLDVRVVVSPAHSGDAALQLTNVVSGTYAFAAYASDPVTVTPGQRYRVSAWWRSATGYVSATGGPPTLWQMTIWRNPSRTNGLYVLWLDANGQPLGNPELAVPLHWNAGNWRLTRRELSAPPGAVQVRVIVGARLAGETLWMDDVALVPSPESEVAVAGTVTTCPSELVESQGSSGELVGTQGNSGECLIQSIPLPESGLVITVTYTAHADHIAVHGEVVDVTGQDRALDVTWGMALSPTPLRPPPPLPILGEGEGGWGGGGEGWTWWDDAHTSRPISDTHLYANAISAIYDGWLPVSLYPYAGIALTPTPPSLLSLSQSWGRGEGVPPQAAGVRGEGLGLALGLPLDRPQLALLAYDGATGRYGGTFHLGISPQAVKVGPRATFDLLLYRFDPAWGFRDVIARHRALQPEAYATALSLYDYAGAEQGWYFTENGVQRALAEDAANVYSAQYTVGELPLKIAPSSDPRPTLDQTLAVVTDTLSSPRPWDAALARAIIQSAVVDPNSDWSLKHIGVYPWALDWWEASWAANLDPDLIDGLALWLLDWRITPAFTATTEAGAHLDGVQIDNFMSTPALDLRPEALAAADWPLAYTPHTYQPAVPNGFAFREYLAFLRDYLDTNWGTERGISVNFWGLGHPNYLAEYIDAFGSEGNLKGNGEGPNWNPEILDYRRAIAYSRPYLFANQTTGLTASEAYTFSQLALLYGVRPRRGPNGADWEPAAEQIISDTVELVTRYWATGWEPVTYAQADSEDIWIERFGRAEFPGVPPSSYEFLGAQGNASADASAEASEELEGTQAGLYFAVHNRFEVTRTATITIETAPLGLSNPDTALVADIVTNQFSPFAVVEGNIAVTLTLGPRDTRVLKVSKCCDFNDDTQVDVVDLQTVAVEWGTSNLAYDFDGSGTVDLADLMVVVNCWGRRY